jgi:TRAP-type mannitol/chloroaromatic compound transport system permease large subunit
MTSGYLGLLMLGLIVAAIMMGFPTAFTLMGLGMVFGFIAYFDADQAMLANKVFDLMVQRTYGGMTNDTLLSIPLFVLMGYVIERAALVDRMFHAVQLSFRRLPASLAVATLLYALMGTSIVLMVPYGAIDIDAPFASAFVHHGMAWAAKVVSLGALTGAQGGSPADRPVGGRAAATGLQLCTRSL